MVNVDFSLLLETLVSALVTVLTLITSCYFVPWLKEKLAAERLEKLVRYTKLAVEAAEQLYGEGTGNEKKEYVCNYLLSKGILFDKEDESVIIESAVYSLPQWLKQ